MPPLVENPLFFIDYDGTLAPLVEDPMQAFPQEEASEVLEKLAARYPVWIVTGRHLRDLAVLTSGLTLRAVGLHGMQEGEIGGVVQTLIGDEAQAALAYMRTTVPEAEGIRVEDKEATFAVHFRQAEDETAARRHLEAWAAQRPDTLEAVWGKKVLELRPKGHNKGVAVARIARAHPGHTPLYLGDDVTDEDAFAALGDAAVTIKVGEGKTRARFRLPDEAAVVSYLKNYVMRS